VHEGGRGFAPVAEFEGALAEPASGNDGNSVGEAAVDFDKGDEVLAIFAMRVAYLRASTRPTPKSEKPG